MPSDEDILRIKNGLLDKCRASFDSHFDGSNAEKMFAAVAPGRVNLIGEHVDYCDGIVLPMAIPMYTMVYGRRASDSSRGYTAVYTSLTGELIQIHRPYDNRNSEEAVKEPSWAGYVRGVLALYPHSVDADMVIESTVPVGGGLSSSAALELSTLFFLRQINNLIDHDGLRPQDCAVLCRRAENLFAHMPCGIMDQMVIAMAEKDHALKIDCCSLATEMIPIYAADEITFVVINCGVRHELASSEYGDRRRNVEEALAKLGATSWRDITLDRLQSAECPLEGKQKDYAIHVVSETQRAQQAAFALIENDLVKLGTLMNESHESLKNLYRVSCPELDELVQLARSVSGVYGSRMTGGGFGGCTVTLVAKSSVEQLEKHIKENYSGKATIYECQPVKGVVEFCVASQDEATAKP